MVFLVIVKDESDFVQAFPDIPYIGELGFGLGGSDAVRLYDSNGALQDEVYYESSAPWPSCADSTGYSLELISPELNNSLSENWNCINENGSPNSENNSSLSEGDKTYNQITLYPNPATTTLYIGPSNESFNVDIYNISGQKIRTYRSTNEIGIRDLSSGFYIVKVNFKNKTAIKKIIKQ